MTPCSNGQWKFGIELSKESKKFQSNFAEAVNKVCAELARNVFLMVKR